MITGIVSAVIIGAIIGGIARLILPGKQNLSVLLTIVVGIVAALVGTILASVLGVAHTRGINWIQLALQIALAVLGVWLLTRTSSRSSTHSSRRL